MNYSVILVFSDTDSLISGDNDLINFSGIAPGKRCPNCTKDGVETWVFSGRSCHICATYVE